MNCGWTLCEPSLRPLAFFANLSKILTGLQMKGLGFYRLEDPVCAAGHRLLAVLVAAKLGVTDWTNHPSE